MIAPSDTIHVACASDNRYLPHAAAMLHSLRWYNRNAEIVVHFLHGPDLDVGNKARMDRMADSLALKLLWVEIDDAMIEGLPNNVGYISKVVWYRVFMPSLLPKLDRVLYLDCDILVTDSILPLWRTPLNDNYFGAVTNIVPEHFSHRAEELGMPGAERYFNLGVALWNLEIMRNEDFTEGVLAYSRQNAKRLRWMEQDAINALFWDRRLPLHPRWNCQNGIYYSSWGLALLDPCEAQEALRRPAIVHFEGGSFAKPWHYMSTHPLRKRYRFHRGQTPWPLRLPEGITLRNVLKKHLPGSVLELIRRKRKPGGTPRGGG